MCYFCSVKALCSKSKSIENKMNEITEHTIDIDRILHDKMGSKVRFVPKPLVGWLKRIIHQDQVNAFIWEHRHEQGVEWLEQTVKYLKMDIEVVGMENLPVVDDGRLYTFVSNHPLGGQDGVALGSIIGRHYNGNFRYLVNDLLMNLPGLAPVCIGINKTGRNGRDFPRMVEAGFSGNNHILMFPAGLNSRKQKDGSIHDIAWKKTFISKSVEYKRDVVPIHFSGRNSNRFYRIANFSDRFLPFNLAMIFLVDEMYRNVGKHFTIHIGKPIPWQTFDRSRKPAEWARYVEDIVYELPGKGKK